MLLSVTLNPSVDISYHLDDFQLDEANRVAQVKKTAGGKGLNVARVAYLLGGDVLATGVLGGSLGSFIEDQLDKDGIKHSFLHTDKESRNCIAILHRDRQTEILEPGPVLSAAEQEKFLKHYERLLNLSDLVSISGSIVKGFSEDVYPQMIAMADSRDVPVILDTSGKALEVTLQNKSARPYLIKPNTSELEQLLGEKADEDIEKIMKALNDPLFEGITWIVVTRGGDGALVKHQNQFYNVTIPEVPVINPVGSGDATVAGLAKAIEQNADVHTVIKYGMAAGILNAMEAQTGFVDAGKFEQFVNKVKVEEI